MSAANAVAGAGAASAIAGAAIAGEVGGAEGVMGQLTTRVAVGTERRAPSAKKRKREAADFIDPTFFMTHEKPDNPEQTKLAQADAYLRVGAGDSTSQLQQAVLDLVEDERDGLRKSRSVLKWDQKKKKYVREHLGQAGASRPLFKRPGMID